MTESTLHIDGMTCGHCVDTVTKELQGLAGIKIVLVSLEKKRALITFDERVIGIPEIDKALESIGYTVTGTS